MPADLIVRRSDDGTTFRFVFDSGVPYALAVVMPAGAPLPLESGRRYCVLVMGGIGVPVGQASFTA